LIVERTDFVSVPVRDLEKSTAWYRDTLGLEQVSEGGWPEFQLGENVSLYLIDPTNIGQEFSGPHTSYIALRVPDVEEAKSMLENAGVEVGDVWDSGVCKGTSFTDPDGNGIMVHHRYAPYPDGSRPDEQG
jgi:catechol 2,3-dioxygenase-like lactoylglutathione lyase family enzyme